MKLSRTAAIALFCVCPLAAQVSDFRIPSLDWMSAITSALTSVPTPNTSLRIVVLPPAPALNTPVPAVVETRHGVPLFWVGTPPSVGVAQPGRNPQVPVPAPIGITHTPVATVVDGQVVTTTVVGYQGLAPAPVGAQAPAVTFPAAPPFHPPR